MKGNLINTNNIPMYESLKIGEMTPVEEYDSIYYKRDDLYMPFQDTPLSGGKVRQACSLILDNYEHIRDNCGGLIATSCNMNSPQGIIIARVAKAFGLKARIYYGGTSTKSILKNRPLAFGSDYFGAELDLTAKLGYDSTTQAALKRQMKDGLKCFNVKFGINLSSNPDSLIKSIGHQVQNIPDELDMLIIPCGSAITATGILWGLKHFNKKVKKIYLIQISGYDRDDIVKEAEKALRTKFPPYEFIVDKTYKYDKNVRLPFGGGFMDPIYEGKAFDYMNRYINVEGKKVLFWIVGDSYPIREYCKKLLSG